MVRAARATQWAALATDVLSVGLGVTGLVLAARSPEGMNDVPAEVFLNTSVLLLIAGPYLHLRSIGLEMDAVAGYNGEVSRAGARP